MMRKAELEGDRDGSPPKRSKNAHSMNNAELYAKLFEQNIKDR